MEICVRDKKKSNFYLWYMFDKEGDKDNLNIGNNVSDNFVSLNQSHAIEFYSLAKINIISDIWMETTTWYILKHWEI